MTSSTRHKPFVSVYELTLLFDEHPTVGIVEAIIEQLEPQHQSVRGLLRAMYGVPLKGKLPDEFSWRLTDEQERLIDLAYSTWRTSQTPA